MPTTQNRRMLFPGKWWVPVALIPTVYLLWTCVTLLNIWLTPFLGIRFSGALVVLASVLIAVSYLLALFAPFALYHDRSLVSEQSEWTPSLLYLLVFVPHLNVAVSTVYLIRRHRFAGTP